MALGFMSGLLLGFSGLETLILVRTSPTAAITNKGMLKPKTNPSRSSLRFG